jgi:PAS domain S-box-containing protein
MTKRTLSARGLAHSNPDLTVTYRRALAGAMQDMALGEGRASDLAIGLRAALRRCKDVLGTEMCALMRPIEPGDMVTALAAEDDPLMTLPPGTDGRVCLIEPVEAAGTRPLMLVALRAGAFTAQDVLFHKALAQAIRDRLDRARATARGVMALPESQALSNFYWQIIDLTNALLAHQGPDLDSHIHSVLARVGQLVGVERSYVYRLHPPGKISSTHEWTAPGVPLSGQISQNLPRALLDPWKDQFQEPQTVAIEDVDTLTKAARTRRFLQAQGVKASVAVPMRRNDSLEGYVGFYCTLRSRAFTPDEMHLLQTVANAIAVVLHRHDAEKEAALAQAQLQAKSDLQSAMLAAVPDLVLELDKRGRCIACTIGVGQQHLVQMEPCIGRKIEELLPAHLGQRFRKTMKVVRADGVRRSFDYDQQIGGETCSCNASIAPRNQTAPQDGWFVILRDITTSRVQQRRIAQLSKIAELTSHMVIVTDADANIEWVNPAFETRTGWRLDEIRGRRPESFLRSRRAGRVASARVEYALRSGSLSQTEILNHDRAGVEYWVSMDVQPMLDDAGAVQGFVSVQTDITEMKRKHSHEMYDWKMAIEGASDGVAMLNAEGYFLFMNHAFRDHFGIPYAEAIKPLHWRDLYPMQAADWFAERPWRQIIVGHAVRVELRGTHRDGRPVRQELSLNTRADGGLLVIARDISDRARAEAEKARLRDQLQLAQQREMISHVAAGVAHDLHNIFAVVSGTASLLEPSLVGNDEALSGIRRIKRAAQMAIDLGAGLATLGRNDARPKPQDLRDLVQQGVDLLGTARIEQHGIVPKLPDSVQTVWADSTKLLQVIVNLALNACEADPDRLTAVRVEVLEQTDWHPGRPPDSGIWSAGRRYRAFQVADNGPGVAPKDRERLFEPYFSTKGTAGTGLGLTIVAGILQQSDAAIWFDSQPGQGTTVTVAWPANAPEPALLPRPLTLMEHGFAPPETGALVGRTILVVDDAPDVADVLAEMLDSVGAQTLALSDPEEAQMLLEANPGLWSALVTDLSMPEKSGVDLARAAAALDPPVPCILVSSHIGFKEVPSGLFAAILLKPTEASVLISAVEQALAIRSKLS